MFKLLLLFTCLYMVMAFEINLGGFQKYCQKYGKNYSLQEQAKKLKTWTRNMLNLAKMQMELKNENRGFEVEANKFTDMDDEERAKVNANDIDYRRSPSMPPVRDQGQCGSCWAFATINAIEVQYGVLNGGLYEFSEQHLLDCRGRSCTHGEFPQDALSYSISDGNVARAEYNNYTATKEQCKHDVTKHFVVEKYDQWYTNSQMEKFLKHVGPLIFYMEVPASFFSYKSGIYNATRQECRNTQGLHAMTIVGIGRENELSYWIVRNSYGPDWGDEGYMKIPAYDNICDMHNNVFGPELYGVELPPYM